MHLWLQTSLALLSRKSETAAAIHYALTLWPAMVRYVDDSRIKIDNSAAERSLRGVAVGRRNYLFAGSGCGGERAAVFYTLIESAKLNGLDRRRRACRHRDARPPQNRDVHGVERHNGTLAR